MIIGFKCERFPGTGFSIQWFCSLQKSTEKRFSALETLVGKVQDEQKNLVNIEKSQTSNGTAKVCMHLY